jgi:predicted ABC-type ATPase
VSDLLPVLWLCGPPGVGKSTVAWELFAGSPGAGYVDIDQLGMCYPAIPADPARTVLEARVLGRVIANFRAAGASSLIVSGYIARRGIHTEYLPDADLTPLRMRCDLAELRQRLETRGRPGEPTQLALRAAREHDRDGLPYPCVDTTGRGVADVLADVRERWPAAPARQPGPWPEPLPPTPGEIVWVCGATATGKSTVGYQVSVASRDAGHITGFVDSQQIGFLGPEVGQEPGNHRLKAANLAALWHHFHSYGARRLVVNGSVEHADQVRLYAEPLPGATLTLYRLHAGPDTLRERIRLRGLGGGPNIAGDQLRGQPATVLDEAHRAAVAQAGALERASLGDLRLDTDGRSVDDLAAEILAHSGW